MSEPDPESFPSEVIDKLATYVYRLIDPRNGETFYVGKGAANRVFSHIRLEKGIEGDDVDNKVKRIREIHLAGFTVAHVIHRHGMDNGTALEVEAALIDAYPGVTNLVDGVGSNDYGTMHAREIIRRYRADVAIFQHKALLINISRTATEASLYEATRYAWKVSKKRAQQAEVVLAIVAGLIVAAFVAEDWLEATYNNFPGHSDMPNRFGFIGKEASQVVKDQYVGKRVPDSFRKRGAANPVRYSW